MTSETRYAKNGDLNIAYQVMGEGPLDIVFVHGWVQSFDAATEINRSSTSTGGSPRSRA
jgi:hypothetical protein